MKESPPAFQFESLTKVYRVYSSPRDRLLEVLTGRPRHFEVRALDGVSGEVPVGSVVGIIGENGSGKSTLLKILTGTTRATSGKVVRIGRIASILELGSSFHPEVTGRQNVILQSALMGLSRSEVERAIPEVHEFSELGEFFDRPVKTYSSGMAMRLAFAAATAVLPDVVILDEALSVGDGYFQKKCVDRISELKASGKTILFCSHAMYFVTTLCDRTIWLSKGRVAAEGPAQQVAMEYEGFLARKQAPVSTHVPAAAPRPESPARILKVSLISRSGEPRHEYKPGEPWVVEVVYEVDSPDRPVHLHVGVATHDQVNCYAADSRVSGVGPFRGASPVTIRTEVSELPLAKGEFIVNVYLVDETGLAIYDSKGSFPFRVETAKWTTGLFEVPVKWSGTPFPPEA